MSKIITDEKGNVYGAAVIIREEVEMVIHIGRPSSLEKNGRFVVVFPEIASTLNANEMTCYAEVGQHGTCTWEGIESCTAPASPATYERALKELSRVGYFDVREAQEPGREHFMERMNEIRRWRNL